MVRVLALCLLAASLIAVANVAVVLDVIGGGKNIPDVVATPTRPAATPTVAPTPTLAPTPTIDTTPTEAQTAAYAQSIGLNVSCAKAYVAEHKAFPNDLQDLASFRASAPPSAQCR